MEKQFIPRDEITAIALELLDLYKDAEDQNIWEYSTDYKRDCAELENEYADYKKKIVSIPAADVRPNDGPRKMTVGELLTSFPWRASVEIVVQDNVDWEADVYGIPNLPEEIAERKVKNAEVVPYDCYSVLSIYAE